MKDVHEDEQVKWYHVIILIKVQKWPNVCSELKTQERINSYTLKLTLK